MRHPSLNKSCLVALKFKKTAAVLLVEVFQDKHAGRLLKMNQSSNLWDLDTDENDENRNAGKRW